MTEEEGSVMSRESREPTAFAVLCQDCGQVFLTAEEYERQMANANQTWRCPRCGQEADWDDANYELRGFGAKKEGEP